MSDRFNIIVAIRKYSFTLQWFSEHSDSFTGLQNLKTFALQQLPAGTADGTDYVRQAEGLDDQRIRFRFPARRVLVHVSTRTRVPPSASVRHAVDR